MGERVIKTGLSKKYKDMLDAVIGQMSDGYWENTPMMAGYWKFCNIGTAGDEVTIEVDETSGARDGDRRIINRFHDMTDDAVKKFFADKIKFLVKEEGIGKWARDNEETTDYLSYHDPYRVKDCYYAYEILKGRNARKHPEYGDVAEANMKTNEDSLVGRLEDVAQVTGILTYNDAWRLDNAAEDDKDVHKKVRDLLGEFDDAAYDGDEDAMENIAKKLKELAGTKKSEGRKHPEYVDVAEAKEGSAKREKGGAKVVSRFTVSDPDLDIDGQTIEEVLDKRFPMGDVFVRIIGKTKCEFRIEGEILKAIDIHWIERTIGAIAALEVNCRE